MYYWYKERLLDDGSMICKLNEKDEELKKKGKRCLDCNDSSEFLCDEASLERVCVTK